jgi:predicted metal-dependent phosphoesterase TrpH
MVDLHTHSNASDGELSPSALIKEAAKRGLSAIALTDHDTINGLEDAKKTAEELGIHFIPGIEIEIKWKAPVSCSPVSDITTPISGISGTGRGGEFHLLGLGISHPSPAFLSAIAELSKLREARNLEILEKMLEQGIKADYEDIKALSGGHSVGRPHFASFLVTKKIVKTHEQAFARFLGIGKPLYVPKEGMEFERAAAIITESGGIPVLAHPMSLYVAWGRLPDLIKELKNRGLKGIEAWHPTAKLRSCRRLEELGKSLGLYITAGSDFHGSIRLDRKLGLTTNGRKIEDSVLEGLPL